MVYYIYIYIYIGIAEYLLFAEMNANSWHTRILNFPKDTDNKHSTDVLLLATLCLWLCSNL